MRFSREFWWIFNQVPEELAVSYLPSRWWCWVTQKRSYLVDLTVLHHGRVQLSHWVMRGPSMRTLRLFMRHAEKVMLGFCCYLLPAVCFAPQPRRLQYPSGEEKKNQSRPGRFGEENLAPGRNRTAATS